MIPLPAGLFLNQAKSQHLQSEPAKRFRMSAAGAVLSFSATSSRLLLGFCNDLACIIDSVMISVRKVAEGDGEH